MEDLVTVRELYGQTLLNGMNNTTLLIKYLVDERKVIKWEDNAETIDYYTHPRFAKKLEEYLEEYRRKQNG